jgi:hypothetical protein
MSLIGKELKGSRFVQDARSDWAKIDGITLGESSKFSHTTTTSTSIGAILDRMIQDPSVVAVVYEWISGKAYMKTGIDLQDSADSKVNGAFTTFVVKSRVKQQEVQPAVSPTGFLKIDGENLSLDGNKFVAVGGNAYWLGYTEEHGYPSKEQIEEVFIAISRMGGNSIRSHTLGHSSGTAGSLRPFDNNLNENAWDSIDYSFSMAKKYNIKIIAPLTDAYSWYNGNYGHFCATRGVPKSDFWTNQEVRADFKDYIYKYLNHFNKYNNCLIKDDPCLGIIELGNELGNIRESANSLTIPTYDWLKDISEFVKANDSNHIILNPADECLGQSGEFSIGTLDTFGAHFYWGDYDRLDRGIELCRGVNKPYIVGEYSSFVEEKWLRDLEMKNAKGSLFWSIYPHRNGIFGGEKIEHNDGFTIHYREENNKNLLLLSQHFCRMRGIPEKQSLDYGRYVPVVAAPVVVPVTPVVVPVTPDSGVWSTNKIYKEGDKTTLNGKKYECVRNHVSTLDCSPGVDTWKLSNQTVVEIPQVINNTKEWKDGASYTRGDIVSFAGKNYSCIQSHTSNEGWKPNVTLLILWNIVSGGSVPVVQPSVPVVQPSVPVVQPSVPVVQPSVPVVQPSVPVTVPSTTKGRLHYLLNGKRPIGTYYQSWSAPWVSRGEDLDLSKIASPVNVVYLSFCTADCTYVKGSNSFGGTGLAFSSDFAVVKKSIEILKNKGVVVMLSVGGATYPFTTYNARNVADLCNDLGCHGIDIDWEDEHGFERFGKLISDTRNALPDGCVSTAAFSVGAYGEGNFVNSPPGSSRTGMNIQGLKSDGEKLDWINIMSYDASPIFDPIESFKAFRSFYKGPLLIGEEVPPEAWGGNVITLDAVKRHSEYVRDSGVYGGIFTWSYQKQGTPSSREILDVANSVLN